MSAVDVLKSLRVAEAYCYGAGATNAANNARAARDAVIDLILCAERVARRAKSIAHNHAPWSIGEQEADALLAALDAMGAKA